MAIELLHPVTVAIFIACAPVATIAVSGAIDYLAHRHDDQHDRDASPLRSSASNAELVTPQRAMPAPDREPASSHHP